MYLKNHIIFSNYVYSTISFTDLLHHIHFNLKLQSSVVFSYCLTFKIKYYKLFFHYTIVTCNVVALQFNLQFVGFRVCFQKNK